MNRIQTKSDPARERILKATVKLFYERGYSNTGINEILSEAGAFKKSLYRYFPSKKDLGISYLEYQEEQIVGLAETLMQKYEKYGEFIPAWLRFLKRRLKTDYLYGCPLANFSNQTHDEPELKKRVLEALDRWNRSFGSYLTGPVWKKKKILDSKRALEYSENMLFLYQGAMQLYGVTGNKKFIDRLESELLRLEETI
ncbi:TetR/AcrR family transcriptional regulator [Leptospira gomenensis]|uniref:TetR/AcrR family transcriptional regulator n=1 Tax=Leptospira gomenensis TaxID=2484974 RepID=A0A5F1Y911_9LEPT|nr:TetR/AcrR family transcriptional regulator [Leptospira gomenensis]TGK32381.1 TetR/AcrR family transcriptional regulator [Leptospira gomenensis]TGK43975.1 TetR/AcrR family transcriptional regulator [Leptospira gomenensis]TGK48948.1 TetR/AcrR family transcriptional regulator [Leptospira gomenensis]TGK54659.1 TetR/AcrR family transcriptional regulator [Leptospira gomenensis]